MDSQTLEPSADRLSGRSAGAIAKRMFLATRPKFFTASALPVLVGFAWGYQASGTFDGVVVTLAVLATVFVHAAANVFNDVGDDINGTDVNNAGRIHPYTGGSRFIQNGVMTRAEMARLAMLLLVFSVIAGGALVALKGVIVLWLGLAGIALGLFYSMPRVQLIAHGLGEISIVFAFGVLPVSGAAWLFTGTFDSIVLWVSVTVGLWVTAILQINEVPDIKADEAAGKRTLAVRLRERGVSRLYFAMHACAFLILVALVISDQLPLFVIALPAALLAMAFKAASLITPPPYPQIVKAIEMTLAIQLLGCIWLVGIFIYMAVK